MRPVKLSFKGLRSYREQTDIDFADLDLFAVIGDTGAGKSTIIEALSLALYATKTWKGGGTLDSLITDGEPSLNVELTFEAEGRTWTVTRRRAHTAGSIDRLVSDDGEKVDGKRDVNARIEALVGLDHDQFTRAVVLPQGRFDELLQTTPAERTKVLRSILDLDGVSATRAEVDRLLSHWSGEQEKWQAARDQYSTDPSADLAEAERDAAGLEARADMLDKAAEQAEQRRAEAERLGSLRGELASTLDRIPAVLPDAVDRLGALAPTWSEQVETCSSIDADLGTIDEERTTTTADAAALLVGFADRDALVGAASRISSLIDELPDALEQLREAETDLTDLVEPPSSVIDPALGEAQTAAAFAREAADKKATAATAALDQATALVSSWRNALADESTAVEGAAAADRELAELDRQILEASAAVKSAEEAATNAADRLNQVLVADAAATAGSDCEPGDHCPVCQQTLPDDYQPPAPSDDVDAARSAAGTTGRERDAAAAVRNKLESARSGLVVKKEAADENLAGIRAQKAGLANQGQDAGVQLDADTNEDALEPLRSAAEAVAGEAAEAAQAESEADEAIRKAQVELDRASATFEANEKAARERVRRASQTVEQLVGRLDALPSAWSHTEVDDPVRRASIVGAALDEAGDQLRATDATLKDLDERERKARASLTTASGTAQETRTEARGLAQSVTARAVQVSHVHSWALESDTLAELMDDLAPVESVDIEIEAPSDLTDKLEDLSELVASSQAIVNMLDSAVTELDQRRVAQEQELEAILSGVACSTYTGLLTELGSARTAKEGSEREVLRLGEAAQRSSELDKRLTMAKPFVANLQVLAYALRDSQFIGYLVSQREVELLAEASRRLKKISGERFAFASGFRIINVRSGEVREPEALSGGERFQSALALALALVEIASRGGGRLDSVFIDEGFGSLDSGSLDQALDALGAVSGGGKMVALVSHLRAVVEYVDDVIYVTKDDTTGSKLELLSAEQQEALLESSSAGGLTS